MMICIAVGLGCLTRRGSGEDDVTIEASPHGLELVLGACLLCPAIGAFLNRVNARCLSGGVNGADAKIAFVVFDYLVEQVGDVQSEGFGAAAMALDGGQELGERLKCDWTLAGPVLMNK